MNTAIIKKISGLVLCLILFTMFSVSVFARYEGNTEVIAHIDEPSSEISDSSKEQSDSSTDNDTVSTGDSSSVYIIASLMLVSSVVIIYSIAKRNTKKLP